MATKTTTTYEASVVLHGVEEAITISDSNEAYTALMDFKAGNTIKVSGEGGVSYIPFHAIIAFNVQTTSESETIKDDFCADGE